MSHFVYLTNNFDLEKLKIFEKIMAFDQAKKWAEAIKQEMYLFI